MKKSDLKRFYRGKKVLVTGGAGFIASNLAIKLINLGARVRVIDSLIPQYGGNLFNIDSVKKRIYISNLSYKKRDFPVSEKASREVLSLPIYPYMSLDDASYVVDCIRRFYK